MSRRYFIGIDPGASGAMAIVCEATCKGVIRVEVVGLYDFEDVQGLWKLKSISFDEFNECKAVLEKVGAMPDQGSVSGFNFGVNYGRWLGRLEALGIPVDRITPQKWKKEMFDFMPAGPNVKSIISPDKKEQGKMRARAKSQHQRKMKTFSRERAMTLFPSIAEKFARVKDDGRAEAMLMAEYCRRMSK